MIQFIRNNRGQTMIENLLAMALLVMVFYMIVDGSIQLFRTDSDTGRVSSEYQMVSQVIETIKGEPAVYQKNFDSATSNTGKYLTSFTYGFNGNVLYMGSPPKCDPNNPGQSATPTSGSSEVPKDTFCDGLISYVIQPSQFYSGLFQGTIRVVHVTKDLKAPARGDNFYYFLLNTNN